MKLTKYVFIFLLLTCCGKTRNSSSQHDDTNTYFGSMFYDLSENGCSTGRHEVQSRIDQEDLFQQYCTILQDNTLNRNCALNLRFKYFEASCSSRGFSWNPF